MRWLRWMVVWLVGLLFGLDLGVPIVPGVPGFITPDPGQQRRLGPLSGAKPHQSSFEKKADPASFRAWRIAAEGRDTAGDQSVHWNVDHANPGPWQSAVEGRNTAGNRLVRGNAIHANHGTWQSAGIQPVTVRFVETPTILALGRNAAGNQPVHVETPTMPTPGHGSPPPKAGTQQVTDQFAETPVMPTPGHGSPPPRAGTQPMNDRFVETPPRSGKQPVTNRFTEIPTLSTPGLDRPSQRMETQLGTNVRGWVLYNRMELGQYWSPCCRTP